MKPWRPERAPLSEDRKQALRYVMGPQIWDALEGYFPDGFLEAYDICCEVLYGGDVTGAEEAQVTDGGRNVHSRWPFKDSRVLPVKAGMDLWAAQVAAQLQQVPSRPNGSGPEGPPSDSRLGVEATGGPGGGPHDLKRTQRPEGYGGG